MAVDDIVGNATAKLLDGLKSEESVAIVLPAGILAGAALLWLWSQDRNPQFALWATVAGLVTVASLARLSQLRNQRSTLLNVEVFAREYFWGREAQVRALVDRVCSEAYVWVSGESGVGKSCLLERGIVPALQTLPGFTPIYVRVWGSDWVLGPLQAIRRALGTATGDNAADLSKLTDALRHLRTYSGTPVLIFDQLDDYLVAHRDKFVDRLGNVLTNAELCRRNPFWKTIAALNAAGEIHCVFATRSDIEWARPSFQFRNDICGHVVPRLERGVLHDFLASQTKPEVISNPSRGWEDLRERLEVDLEAQGGLLPVQMRLALRSLATLRRLTVSDYLKAGGLTGLIASLVDDLVKQAAQCTVPPAGSQSVLTLLMGLLDDRRTKTVIRQEEELLNISSLNARQLEPVLDFLAQQEIVRAVGAPGDPQRHWQLDHDYLCNSILLLHQRANPWQHRLEAVVRRYSDAPNIAARFRALPGPLMAARLAFESMRARVRLGRHWWMVAAGLAKWSVPFLAIGVAVLWLASDLQMRNEAQALLNGLGLTPRVEPQEAERFWQIKRAPLGIRRRLLELVLADENNLTKLESPLPDPLRLPFAANVTNRIPLLLIAVAGIDPGVRANLLHEVVRPLCYARIPEKITLAITCAKIAADLDQDAVRLSKFAVRALEERNQNLIHFVPGSLAQVSGRDADELAGRLTAVWVNGRDWDTWSVAEEGLTALTPRVSRETPVRLAERFVDALKNRTKPADVFAMARGLAVLGPAAITAKGGDAAESIVARMKHQLKPGELSELAEALWALGPAVPDPIRREGMSIFLSRFAEEPEKDALNTVSRLGNQSIPGMESEVADMLLKLMPPERGSRLNTLVNTLSPVLGRLPEGNAREIRDRILGFLLSTKNKYYSDSLTAENIAKLGITADGVHKVAVFLLTKAEQKVRARGYLSFELQGFAEFAAHLQPPVAAVLASRLVRLASIGLSKYDFERSIRALTSHLSTDAIDRLADEALEAFRRSPDSKRRTSLVELLGLIGDRMSEKGAGELARWIVGEMQGVGQDYSLEAALQNTVNRVAPKMSAKVGREIADKVLSLIVASRDPLIVSRWTTVYAMPGVRPSPQEVARAADHLLAIMRGPQNRGLLSLAYALKDLGSNVPSERLAEAADILLNAALTDTERKSDAIKALGLIASGLPETKAADAFRKLEPVLKYGQDPCEALGPLARYSGTHATAFLTALLEAPTCEEKPRSEVLGSLGMVTGENFKKVDQRGVVQDDWWSLYKWAGHRKSA